MCAWGAFKHPCSALELMVLSVAAVKLNSKIRSNIQLTITTLRVQI